MADFLHAGWSLYVAILTILSILACFILAWRVSRAKTTLRPDGEVDTTGHVWDSNLQELNNPLPRWWLYLFYITCVFGVLYLILYPGLGAFDGTLKWSSANQYDTEIETVNKATEPLFTEYLAKDIEEVAGIPEAVAMGERLFLTYCSQCHGSDARGAKSFPNLTDSDWLGAGDSAYIKHTIINGRNAMMPAMATAVGNTEMDITGIANYVLSLSDSPHDKTMAELGQPKYIVCAGCHGTDGTGLETVGAPNLTDNIWLHGGTLDDVMRTVTYGIDNRMPAFGELLGEGKSHVLAAYVWTLSNHQTSENTSD